MYSHWSEYSHGGQNGDRNSGQWDDKNDRRDGRLKTHSKNTRDSYQNYRGDGHSSTEMGDRSREYNDSPNRWITKDSSNRDWSRKSPVRRHVSSPIWDASEKGSRRYTEDEDGDTYRHTSLDRPYRLSPDSFSHNHYSKDLKSAPPREDDYRYRRTPPDFRSRNQCDEFTQRKQHEDLSVRNLSDCFSDINDRKRRRNFSPEGKRSPDRFTKMYTNRGRMNSPPSSVYHEDYHQNRTRAPNESSTQAFGSNSTPQSASVPETKLSKGFQLFLDVLNKGVNVDALTKIVSQTSTEVGDENVSQSSFMNSEDRSLSPGSTEKQQKLPVNENVLQRTDGRENLFKSPSVEKIALTPEDEEKRKQMQNVLQVIGVDLGFEELGKMSHRIQERLYGKKDDDNEQKLSRERSTNQAFTSRHQSRSSSSGSSFSPTTRDCSIKKDLGNALINLTEVDQNQVQSSAGYSQKMSSGSFQSSKDSKSTSQKKTPAWGVLSPTSTDAVTQPPPASLIPTFFPTNCPPLPYPRFPPVPPPGFPGAVFPPHWPPMLPYMPVPPNVFPPVLAQIRHLLPPSPQFFPPPNVNPLQVLNKTQASQPQESKAPPRTRCLRVIK